jgi:hypothetical protein
LHSEIKDITYSNQEGSVLERLACAIIPLTAEVLLDNKRQTAVLLSYGQTSAYASFSDILPRFTAVGNPPYIHTLRD